MVPEYSISRDNDYCTDKMSTKTHSNENTQNQLKHEKHPLGAVLKEQSEKTFTLFAIASLHFAYSKTCLKRPIKNRQNEDLNDKLYLNECRKYYRIPLEHSAILMTCIKR